MIDMTKPLMAEIVAGSTVVGALIASVVSSPPDPATVAYGAGGGAVISVATLAYYKAKVDGLSESMNTKASSESVATLTKLVEETRNDIRQLREWLIKESGHQ